MGLFTNRKREDDEDGSLGLVDSGSALAQYGIFSEEPPAEERRSDEPTGFFTGAAPDDEIPSAPRRRLDDAPRAQAGNVEIDAAGLLEMLGVDRHASLAEISEARQQFLIDHRPSDADDFDATILKERIRREVNTAYASFRLTHAA